MNVLNDVTGSKKSSKRLGGLSCIGVGLLIALVSVVLDIFGNSATVELVKIVLTSIFTTGAALLGISVAEYFSRNNKTNKNDVGYKKD